MSRNGSGVYSLPAGNPVVTGTTISSSWANTTLSDIATALTGSVAADGQTAMTGNLQMGNNKITGLAVATASGDALSYGQAATISALTVSGAFSANGGATLGDASGDALTINSSAVSIPNGLNFDSNTFVIDATNNRVGVGTASPSQKIHASDSAATYLQLSNTSGTPSNIFIGALGSNNSIISRDGTTGNNPLVFSTGTTERMRIDSSGNVGIGTSSPVAKLDVTGVINASSNISTASGNFVLGANDTYVGFAANNIKFNNTSDRFIVTTGATERMRIDSSGNLLVGTTSAGTDKVRFASAGLSANQLGLVSTDDTSGNGFIIFRNSATNAIGSISRVGTTNAVAYNTTSDERLKSNIQDAEPVIDKLMTVKVRQYDWTQGELHQDYGFIAQELEPVLSGIVTKGKTEEDMWQLDYARLTPHLVKAIQEQQAIITDLKARIETLESK